MRGWFSALVFIALPIAITGILIYLSQHIPPSASQTAFHPQQTKQFIVKETTNNPLTIRATTLPQFAIELIDQKFQNVWIAHAQERESSVNSHVANTTGTTLTTTTTFDNTKKEIIVTPQIANDFKPGLYHLNVKVKTYTGKYVTITQDFRWGVLAINTSKAVYQPGETVKIGMGVLDDKGNTKCITKGDITYPTAKVWLTIISPSGKKQDLSSGEGTVVGSKDCAATSVTNNPDFQAQTTAEEVGKYTIHMTAENINGTRSINDYFTVSQEQQPFTIMRTSYPTRIYPYGHYPVEVTIIANQDYSGPVTDYVPSSFQISNISDNGQTLTSNRYQKIQWQVALKARNTYRLTYDIKFPMVSPEFYLVGPLKIGNFDEGREWQIASDAIQLAQNVQTNSISSTATSLTATYNNPVTANDMELIICATGTTGSSVSINTPTRNTGENSWSTAFSSNSFSGVKIRAWYRLGKATDNTTLRCNFGSGNGTKSIQIFEYSGLSTTTIRDTSKTRTSTSCTTSFASNSSTFTPGNPVVLVVASFTATNKRTVTGFTSGYTKETEFQGPSAGTFSTHDQVTSSIANYTDTIDYNTTGGTCAAGIVSFNSPISISQNGYQFFQNTNAVDPASQYGGKIQNENITLANPHDQFRLRVLLDVDGTQSIGLQTADFRLNYATLSAQVSGCNDPSLEYDPVSTPGTGTDIAYYSNGLGSGQFISSSGLDPADSGYTTVYESYYEDDTSATGPSDGSDPGAISNDQGSISGNHAGLWDVSLVDNTNDVQSNTYCIKVTNGDGSDLTTYVRIPTVTTFYNEVNILGGTTIKGGTTIR